MRRDHPLSFVIYPGERACLRVRLSCALSLSLLLGSLSGGCARGMTGLDDAGGEDGDGRDAGRSDAGVSDAAAAPPDLVDAGQHEPPLPMQHDAASGASDAALTSGDDASVGSDDAAVVSEPDAAPPAPDPQCQAGTYAGSFSGNISVLLFVNIPITGSITIDAHSDSSGDTLTIDGGKVVGSDSEGNPVTADVSGILDCASKTLRDGKLSNGVYVRKTLNQTVNFAGTVDAMYQPGNPPTVTGSWHTSGGIEMGEGPFDAVLQQP